ncbi:hypothetical protein SUGI_0346420 [Cryptomeria japonica]|nr:hypothetical protein SUGI_0346420 [Cryptomeria japonica]
MKKEELIEETGEVKTAQEYERSKTIGLHFQYFLLNKERIAQENYPLASIVTTLAGYCFTALNAMAQSGTQLNDLPDDVLCLILSKLPLDQAIRCSVLSRKWELLSRSLPSLIFSEDIFYSLAFRRRGLVIIIDGILNSHSAGQVQRLMGGFTVLL